MLTGVRSTITLDSYPSAKDLDEFRARSGREVLVVLLEDGTVRVESTSSVDCSGDDIAGLLRSLADAQRLELGQLRSTSDEILSQ